MSNVTQASATRLLRFALVSGTGLVLDTAVFLALVRLGLLAGYANLISASMAVTFVYFVSTKRVFEYAGRFLLGLFLIYCVYQVLAVSAASWTVGALVAAGFVPLLAKVLILPVTFLANYLFMAFLTGAKV
jgi:putative flippase GtrA